MLWSVPLTVPAPTNVPVETNDEPEQPIERNFLVVSWSKSLMSSTPFPIGLSEEPRQFSDFIVTQVSIDLSVSTQNVDLSANSISLAERTPEL